MDGRGWPRRELIVWLFFNLHVVIHNLFHISFCPTRIPWPSIYIRDPIYICDSFSFQVQIFDLGCKALIECNLVVKL